MCLIANVPAGKRLSREVFDNAHRVNSDGIGVMSLDGIEKFYGRKALKLARAYTAVLADKQIAHAVHWRFATHGSKSLALCHPFKLPNGKAWIMHNGVIQETAQYATPKESDTLLFAELLDDAPGSSADALYWNQVGTTIGRGNKVLVMYEDGTFVTVNKDAGTEIDDIWYSNTYSLPRSMQPNHNYYEPSRRMRSYGGWYGQRSVEGTSSIAIDNSTLMDLYGPFGTIVWSSFARAYGYYEKGSFHPLTVSTPAAPTKWEDLSCKTCYRPKVATALRDACECKPALSSGPTLDTGETAALTVYASPEAPCGHGSPSWENCLDCINKLESDSAAMMAADNGGYTPESARESSIIHLPVKYKERNGI